MRKFTHHFPYHRQTVLVCNLCSRFEDTFQTFVRLKSVLIILQSLIEITLHVPMMIWGFIDLRRHKSK